MARVSVVIPVYNTKEFIEDCIKSVLGQTYNDIEILLINDGSEQESEQFLEKISNQDERIQLYHFRQRRGVGAARNLGVEKASGEYIYFLDSDDYIPEKTLEL